MNNREEILDDDVLIEMTDEDGNVFYYVEEMIVPVDGKNFALLVELKKEHAHCDNCGCDCDCGCDDDDEVIIAKVIVNEDGKEEYIEPTDEEFDRFLEIYENLLDEEE